MQRANGFYWVRFKGYDWFIAEWIGDVWISSRHAGEFHDSDMEIDERRIERTDKAILPDGDYDPIPDNPEQYISDNPYICKPD